MGITIRNSTKPERVLADMLIKSKTSFKFREIIQGRECDFVIGRVIVEVDGVHHDNPRSRAKDKLKNEILAKLGYIPLHFSAKEIRTNPQKTFKEIKNLLKANEE